MPYSAVKVANEILRLAQVCTPPRPVTPLQLLKLVYVADGWSWGIRDRQLVNEPAEAWTYGPVVPSLYRAIRHYRALPVTFPIPGDYDRQEIAPEDRDFIAEVFGAYGHLSGVQLSNLTHMPGTPWSMTWDNGAGQNEVIRPEIVAAHYKALADHQLD